MSSIDKARTRLLAGDAKGALETLAPDLKSTPTDDVLIVAARAWRMQGRHAEAATALSGVFDRNRGNGTVAHNLAAARGDAGDHAGAVIAARQAIALRDAPESWLVLGRALQALGDMAEAERRWRAPLPGGPVMSTP